MSAAAILPTQAQQNTPTKGKEFWVGFMNNFVAQPQGEELLLFISADENTSGTVEIPAQSWEADFLVPAGGTTTVQVPNNLAEHFSSDIIENKGVYVSTSDTVSVFAINFNPNSADGSKILPISSTGTEYMVMSYPGVFGQSSEFVVVATTDGTQVEVTTTADTQGGAVAGVPFTIDLDRGQSFQIQAQGNADLTGSRIVATASSGSCRPFAVFSGASCAQVPSDCATCDHLFEQVFPTSIWGDSYFFVPFNVDGNFISTLRILAKEDNTEILLNGTAVATLMAGEVYEENHVSEVKCVSSDRPVLTAQYMQGLSCTGANSNLGDPTMILLNDANQQIDDVSFSTVDSDNINSHKLLVITDALQTDELLLDGVPVDVSLFTPMPDCPDHAYADFEITEGGHNLVSPFGFTAYVYGFGAAETYGYSVGSFSNADLVNSNLAGSFCTNTPLTISAPATITNVAWSLLPDENTTIGAGNDYTLPQPNQPGLYKASGFTTSSGCAEELFYLVETPDVLNIDFPNVPSQVCSSQSTTIMAEVTPNNNILSYTWTYNGDAAGQTQQIYSSPVTPGWFSVDVSSPTGCAQAQDSVFIDITQGSYTSFGIGGGQDQICSSDTLFLSPTVFQVKYLDESAATIDNDFWGIVQGGQAANLCAGEAIYFTGENPRQAATENMNTASGGQIGFDFYAANANSGCEDIDFGENILLQYKVPGSNWTILTTLYEYAFDNWTTLNFQIPEAAQSSNAQFRFRQLGVQSENDDVWAIRNMYVSTESLDQVSVIWTATDGLDNPTSLEQNLMLDAPSTITLSSNDPVFGCLYTAEIAVDVGQAFTVAAPESAASCDGSDIALQATPSPAGNYNYDWNLTPAEETNTTSLAITEDALMQLTVSGDNNCAVKLDIPLYTNPLSGLSLTFSSDPPCAGTLAEATATATSTATTLRYDWLGVENSTADVANFIYETGETISITVVDTLSLCSIMVDSIPDVVGNFEIALPDTVFFCMPNTTQLQPTVSGDVTDPNDLTWSWLAANLVSDAAASAPFITSTTSAEIHYTATDVNGCVAADTVQLAMLLPEFSLGDDINICSNNGVQLSAPLSGLPTLWSTTEMTETITVNTPQTIWLELTGDQGCTKRDSVEVALQDAPIPNLPETANLCTGQDLILMAENPTGDYDFEWQNGTTTASATIVNIGWTWVLATNSFGCETTDSTFVTAATGVSTILPTEIIRCEEAAVTLLAGPAAQTYLWSTAQTGNSIATSDLGLITVEISNTEGCSLTDSVNVVQGSIPMINLGPDQGLCEGSSLELTSGQPDLTHTWSTGETGESITVWSPGLYTVSVSNGECTASDAIELGSLFAPKPTFGPDTLVCMGYLNGSTLLGMQDVGLNYIWSTGETSQFIRIRQGGDYTVQVETSGGCLYNFGVEVRDYCAEGVLYVPNAFSPNGDGVNDFWRAKGEGILTYECSIFDQWGERIFFTKNMDTPWIGNKNGGTYYVNPGPYHFQIKFTALLDGVRTSNVLTRTGMVNLIR